MKSRDRSRDLPGIFMNLKKYADSVPAIPNQFRSGNSGNHSGGIYSHLNSPGIGDVNLAGSQAKFNSQKFPEFPEFPRNQWRTIKTSNSAKISNLLPVLDPSKRDENSSIVSYENLM